MLFDVAHADALGKMPRRLPLSRRSAHAKDDYWCRRQEIYGNAKGHYKCKMKEEEQHRRLVKLQHLKLFIMVQKTQVLKVMMKHQMITDLQPTLPNLKTRGADYGHAVMPRMPAHLTTLNTWRSDTS